jgi:hypothetical protein
LRLSNLPLFPFLPSANIFFPISPIINVIHLSAGIPLY